MSITKRPLMLAIGFGLALTTFSAPIMAQEAAPAADAAPDAGLNMGVDPNAPPTPLTQENAEVGQTYTLASFEKWEQRCNKTADGSDPCQLYQLLFDSNNNSVAEMSMFPLPAGGKAAAGATIIVPLETLLTANLLLTVDGSKAKIYPFTFCGQIGCIARLGFTADEVAQFKKGAKATMTIVPAAAPDQKVDLDVSLKGFTAGYDAVAATLK